MAGGSLPFPYPSGIEGVEPASARPLYLLSTCTGTDFCEAGWSENLPQPLRVARPTAGLRKSPTYNNLAGKTKAIVRCHAHRVIERGTPATFYARFDKWFRTFNFSAAPPSQCIDCPFGMLFHMLQGRLCKPILGSSREVT